MHIERVGRRTVYLMIALGLLALLGVLSGAW